MTPMPNTRRQTLSARGHLSNRRGFALPMAIGAMVIIGTMIAGVFFVATQENRTGRNTMAQEQAFRAGEAALVYTYATWNNATMNAYATGATRTVTYDSTSKGFTVTVRTTRINNETYWIVSEATSSLAGTTSSHRTGAVIRVGYPAINFLG